MQAGKKCRCRAGAAIPGIAIAGGAGVIATIFLLGLVLVAMALAEHPVRQLPLSSALVYLIVGWLADVLGTPLAGVDPGAQSALLLVMSEWALLISLFAIGLRLRVPPVWRLWRVAVLLAGSGMLVTIGLAAVAAHF